MIVAVLGVWGTIGYKMRNGLSTKDTVVTGNDYEINFSPKKTAINQTFEISSVDKDPFLGTLTNKQSINIKKKPKKNLKSEINSPIISYLGLIKQQQSNNQIFIIKINNNQHLIKKGQEIDGVNLVKGDSKSITVKLNGKNETIVIE